MSNKNLASKSMVLLDVSLKDAIKKMDENRKGVICVVDNDQNFKGIFTDGDFRRLVLQDVSLNTPIAEVMNKNPVVIQQSDYSDREAKKIFKREEIIYLPILKDTKLVDLLLESSILRETDVEYESPGLKGLNVSVVIMAGGFGTRLQPVTNVLPKLLIPINNSTVAELIIDEFLKNGANHLIFSIRYKGNMIRAYFDDYPKACSISFVEENKPLGTAGALKLLEGRIDSTFIVSNCDILLYYDYRKIYDFHKKGGFSITLVASLQHHKMPYGVCELKKEGELKCLKEKPEYDMLVNIGFYIIEPDAIKYIPQNTFFHMTDLIRALQANGCRIGVYPVYQSNWIDVGQWEDYKKVVRSLEI